MLPSGGRAPVSRGAPWRLPATSPTSWAPHSRSSWLPSNWAGGRSRKAAYTGAGGPANMKSGNSPDTTDPKRFAAFAAEFTRLWNKF